MTNSAGCSGSGRRPTRCWARPGSGGKKTGKNPTDRGKKGTKKSLLTDGDGGPLGVVIAGANVVDQKLLKETIEAIVVERPDPEEVEQNSEPGQGVRQPHGVARRRPRAATCRTSGGSARRRSVRPVEGPQAASLGGGADVRMAVEVPGILVRYEKKDENYLGLIQLACGLLWYRRLHRMGRCDATQNTT